MAKGQFHAVLGHIRRLLDGQHVGARTDRQLLDQFACQQDQAAFEVLVQRHAAMVLGVCQRLLPDPHDADDAFQATFLVLLQKAASLAWQESIGNWLYSVAVRVALKARVRSAQRRQHERQAAPVSVHDAASNTSWQELRPILDVELDRLPAKYRAPLVLCYLEGRSNEEAAQQLGCPEGTVKSRLARGREMLRSRLARRGLGVPATALGTMLAGHAAPAAVPASLTTFVAQAALCFATHDGALAGTVSAPVLALAEGVVKAMWLNQVRYAVTAMVLLCVLGTGVWMALPRDRALAVPLPQPVPGQSIDMIGKYQISEALPVNGLEFQVAAPAFCAVPGADGVAILPWQLRVVNRGKADVRFLPIPGTPRLETADGRQVASQVFGSDRLRLPPKPITLEPNKPATFNGNLMLWRVDNKPMMGSWQDETGMEWRFNDLQPGRYRLRLQYAAKKQGADDWSGTVLTSAVAVEIGELRASKPAIVQSKAASLEVTALTDAVWYAPAAGASARVNLGYRLANVNRALGERLNPAIAAVTLKSADGKEFTSAKTATVLEGDFDNNYLLLGAGRTITEVATLSRAGDAMTLHWADGTGQVWKLDGLRRGRYSLSLLIQARKVQPPAWIGWSQDLQTESVAIELKAEDGGAK